MSLEPEGPTQLKIWEAGRAASSLGGSGTGVLLGPHEGSGGPCPSGSTVPTHSQVSRGCRICSFPPASLINGSKIRFPY